MNSDSEYLTGFLTVEYGFESVSLMHKVQGRYSYLELAEGDLIEVKDGDSYREITYSEAFEQKTKSVQEDFATLHSMGGSIYQGAEARVIISPRATIRLQKDHKRYVLRALLELVKARTISHEEAMQMYFDWEDETDD